MIYKHIVMDVPTNKHSDMIDITESVRQAIDEAGLKDGLITLWVPHTTAGVTVNENADPDVVHDMLLALEKAVPWRQEFYHHNEGNSSAHVKSSMMGCSLTIPVHNGSMTLGTWQGIYFCEFDGPRNRQTNLTIIGQ